MDPISAALQVITALTNAYTAFLQAATAKQKEQIIDAWLEDRAFWQNIFKQLPKG